MEQSTITIKSKIKNTLVNRNEVLEDIEEMIAFRTKNPKPFLYHIYGVGGIGKSSLKKALKHRLEQASIQPVELNFANENNRLMDRALNTLRREFIKNHGFIFPSYNFARVVYWTKKDPEAPIMNNQDLQFLEEGDYTANLVKDIWDDAKDLPIIGWIPKGSNFLWKYSSVVRDWWHTKGKSTLKELDQMDFDDIGEMLLDYWFEDVRFNLKKKKDTTLLILLDTFEALWEEEGRFFRNKGHDNWIYRLLTELQGAIFVSTGRNPLETLKSDPALSYHDCELKPFDDREMKVYFEAFEIHDESIQTQIMEVTKGIPLYLSLEVQNILFDRHQLTTPSVSNSLDTVVKRFLKYKSPQEEYFLKILSIPERVTLEMMDNVLPAIGYHLTPDEQRELLSDTFIEKEGDYYYLHDLIREWFAQQLEGDLNTKKVHKALFQYFSGKIIDGQQNHMEEWILGALRHGRKALTIEEYSEWFVDTSSGLSSSVSQNVRIRVYETYIDFLDEIQADAFNIGQGHYLLGRCFFNAGRLFFEKAEQAFLEAEQVLRAAVQEDVSDGVHFFLHTELAKTKGQLYMLMRRDDLAEECFRNVLAFYDEYSLDPDMYDMFATDLLEVAQFFVYKGKEREAKHAFEKIDVKKCTSIELLDSLGGYYNAAGKYRDAAVVFQKAIELARDTTDQYERHASLRVLTYGLGCSYENLKEWDQAVDCFQEGLSYVDDQRIEQRFMFVNGIAKVYRAKKDYQMSLTYLDELLVLQKEYYESDDEAILLTESEQAYLSILLAKEVDLDDPRCTAFKEAVEKLLDLACQTPFIENYLDMYLPMKDNEWKKRIKEEKYKDACTLLIHLIRRLNKFYQEDNRRTMSIKLGLAQSYHYRGKAFYTRAEECYLEALTWYQTYEPRTSGYIQAVNGLKQLYLSSNNKIGLAKLERKLR